MFETFERSLAHTNHNRTGQICVSGTGEILLAPDLFTQLPYQQTTYQRTTDSIPFVVLLIPNVVRTLQTSEHPAK